MSITMRNEKTGRFIKDNWSFNEYLGAAVLGGLTGLIFTSWLLNPVNHQKGDLRSLNEVKLVQEVEAKTPYCFDPISCIRDVGESMGADNKTIMTFIRIAKAEARCNTKTSKTCIPDNGVSGIGIDPQAKNPNSSARGMFQFLIGTWEDYNCEGSRTNIEDASKCAFKLYKQQSERYIKVYKTTYQFNDWDASKFNNFGWGK